MLVATTIGIGPFRPAIRMVFNERTIWTIDQSYDNEDEAYEVARNRLDVVEEAMRKSIYAQGFQMEPGT